jgi:hypothetical protein
MDSVCKASGFECSVRLKARVCKFQVFGLRVDCGLRQPQNASEFELRELTKAAKCTPCESLQISSSLKVTVWIAVEFEALPWAQMHVLRMSRS